jgi:LmbE family N-acetylglucosaminyl deacetylase/CheY-like chemotaxis protein
VTEEQIRVLVVEDDADTAEYTRTALARRGIRVELTADPFTAIESLTKGGYDLLITDIQLPGMSGLQLLSQVHAQFPGLPVIVMTAFASVDYAVEALRKDADEFLVKPVSPSTLAERVQALAAAGRLARSGRKDQASVLAIGAHPDDVEIGVGATLGAHRAAGDLVAILTLSGGEVGGAANTRQHEALAAAEVIGARLFLHAFEDTRLDPSGGLITTVEETIREVEPTIIYTHTQHDRHQDHRAVSRSVEVAARRVPAVACYQSPSATIEFQPTSFVPIDGFLDVKLTMLAAFKSQGHRDYMQPDLVRATARYWSRFTTATYVEPLEVLRSTTMLSGAPGHVPRTQTAPHVDLSNHGSGT